ncbi:unnamed protein product [Vitrella brassicaformis CCMP3155]|uniref:UBC core domain-containing protein n=1 Tax=Vitrella brassicaformis (strain CCMP3155) TaxID=1169540 RepID=A0A0G4G019_VITBC|nr:unnamed protein product [Vitrella brassicaformis CCMP3155]|eukprot:CEM20852.1 unnamed protein product [Vitrella brassicaformis CCMP3155]
MKFQKRIEKEFEALRGGTVPHVKLDNDTTSHAQQRIWTVTIEGAESTLYEGEVFKLRFRFPDKYPLESPEVMFVEKPPVHPHIYTNGHICLSILYEAWSPALTVSAVCLSILSMLSSCTKKEHPPDNDKYVLQSSTQSPKSTSWMFHDDRV